MKSGKPGKGIDMALANLVAGAFFFLLGLFFYFWAVPYHISASFSAMKGIGPKAFPSVFSLLVAALGIFLTFKSYLEFKHHRMGGPSGADEKGENLVRFSWIALVILFVGVLFSALLRSGGFLVMNTLSILILFKVFGGREWWKGLLLGMGVSACLYLFFSSYLDLAIPVGVWFGG